MHQLTRAIALSMLTLGACGGDSTNDDGGADATQGSDASSDVVGTSDSSTKSDACVAIDGGAACDPAHITCGTLLCDAGSQVCCINDGGAKETCTVAPPTDGGKPPPNSCTATKMACDEAADCPSGNVCCGFVGAGGGFTTSCAPSCGTGLQFCHGSAECVTGECTLQAQCHGVTIETCSSFCP